MGRRSEKTMEKAGRVCFGLLAVAIVARILWIGHGEGRVAFAVGALTAGLAPGIAGVAIAAFSARRRGRPVSELGITLGAFVPSTAAFATALWVSGEAPLDVVIVAHSRLHDPPRDPGDVDRGARVPGALGTGRHARATSGRGAVRGVHDAFARGDLDALRAALGDPSGFPDVWLPPGRGGHVLEYAIYHAPLAFVRTLLEAGADPRYRDPAGFPALIAALSSGRANRFEIVELLLDHGADVQQRGVHDYTPLHYAAAADDAAAIELLLARGADPAARTRVDDYATPIEEAEILGWSEAVRALRDSADEPGDRREEDAR